MSNVQLVGILNVTPDSFSDGGKYVAVDQALKQADALFADGAEIVDVGAESTRPGATPVTTEEEWQRLEPVLKILIKKYPGKISVDSYKPEILSRSFAIGPVIVNDVTGLSDPAMVELILKHQAVCIISHIDNPDIQRVHERTPTHTVNEIKNYLLKKKEELIEKGLPADHVILDPGIGFGKPASLNRELLTFASLVHGHKVMIGYSRKRFLGEERMDIEVNARAGLQAMQSGAQYLRVHDVSGHRQLLDKR